MTLIAYPGYSSLICNPFKFMTNYPNELHLQNASKVPLKSAKVKNLRDLFPYLKQESVAFYQSFLSGSESVNNEDDTDSVNGDVCVGPVDD